jgi:hypothetical protein
VCTPSHLLQIFKLQRSTGKFKEKLTFMTSYRSKRLSIIDPWSLVVSNSCQTAFLTLPEHYHQLVSVSFSICEELVPSRKELQRVVPRSMTCDHQDPTLGKGFVSKFDNNLFCGSVSIFMTSFSNFHAYKVINNCVSCSAQLY